MTETILQSLDIWTGALAEKHKGRVRSIDNISHEGIASLRQLILELAVRGKLVPQDPQDEPAAELLKKIAAEKARLIAERAIKKTKALPHISQDEKPYTIPKSWCYVRLNDIGDWGAGATPLRSNPSYYGGDIPWFKSGELSSNYIDTSEETVTDLALKETSLRYNYIGDVLIAMYGATIGKASILNVRATTNQAVCACTPFNGVSNEFLLTILKAYKERFISRGAGGAQPNISREKIIETVIALPPLKEQKRIVVRVKELMQLCDELEEVQSRSLHTHQLLVSTLLETLTKAKDADELDAAWQRMEQHFDTLFCTEDSIELLKQTILQLAIMGRLVKQDPKDEPASELLKKVAVEKAKLIAEGKIKKEKPLPAIKEDEKPFVLPRGWEWVRLNDAIDVRDGTHDSPKDAIGKNTYPLVTSKNFKNGLIDFDTARYISEEDHNEISKRSNVERFDILFSMIGGNLGNQVMVLEDRPFSIKNVALFKYYNRELTPPSFIKKFVEYLAFNLQSQAKGGAQPFISLGYLRNLLMPLPPLKEQQRIIAKVDELMGICDNLKESLQKTEAIKVKLSATMVKQAL